MKVDLVIPPRSYCGSIHVQFFLLIFPGLFHTWVPPHSFHAVLSEQAHAFSLYRNVFSFSLPAFPEQILTLFQNENYPTKPQMEITESTCNETFSSTYVVILLAVAYQHKNTVLTILLCSSLDVLRINIALRTAIKIVTCCSFVINYLLTRNADKWSTYG